MKQSLALGTCKAETNKQFTNVHIIDLTDLQMCTSDFAIFPRSLHICTNTNSILYYLPFHTRRDIAGNIVNSGVSAMSLTHFSRNVCAAYVWLRRNLKPNFSFIRQIVYPISNNWYSS